MEVLPRRQAQLLNLIADDVCGGRSPVISALAKAMGVAGESTVTASLTPLQNKGFISVQGGVRGQQRIIELTKRGKIQTGLLIPVLGSIPAGPLIEATEECDEWIDSTTNILNSKAGDFYLKVTGDSMLDAHIITGDRVLLRPSVALSNGEMAGVLIDNDGRMESTLKKVYIEPDENTVRLEAANPAYADMMIPAEKVTIAGAYRGMFRPY